MRLILTSLDHNSFFADDSYLNLNEFPNIPIVIPQKCYQAYYLKDFPRLLKSNTLGNPFMSSENPLYSGFKYFQHLKHSYRFYDGFLSECLPSKRRIWDMQDFSYIDFLTSDYWAVAEYFNLAPIAGIKLSNYTLLIFNKFQTYFFLIYSRNNYILTSVNLNNVLGQHKRKGFYLIDYQEVQEGIIVQFGNKSQKLSFLITTNGNIYYTEFENGYSQTNLPIYCDCIDCDLAKQKHPTSCNIKHCYRNLKIYQKGIFKNIFVYASMDTDTDEDWLLFADQEIPNHCWYKIIHKIYRERKFGIHNIDM